MQITYIYSIFRNCFQLIIFLIHILIAYLLTISVFSKYFRNISWLKKQIEKSQNIFSEYFFRTDLIFMFFFNFVLTEISITTLLLSICFLNLEYFWIICWIPRPAFPPSIYKRLLICYLECLLVFTKQNIQSLTINFHYYCVNNKQNYAILINVKITLSL